MTFLYGQLEQLMVDYNNSNLVIPLKEELDQTYKKFVSANKDLLMYINEGSEMQDAIKTYENQTKGKLEFDEYYRSWIVRVKQQEDQVPLLDDQVSIPSDHVCRTSSKKSSIKTRSKKSSCKGSLRSSTSTQYKIKELNYQTK